MASHLIRAKQIVVFSGAGTSAESGIATFRAPEIGVWANKIALGYFGTPMGWKITPGLAWKAYNKYFRDPIAKAQPNEGHYALSHIERLHKIKLAREGVADAKRFEVITQNVDGLHQRAGNEHVYELHGTVFRHKCTRGGHLHPYQLSPGTLSDLSQFAESEDENHGRTSGEIEEEIREAGVEGESKDVDEAEEEYKAILRRYGITPWEDQKSRDQRPREQLQHYRHEEDKFFNTKESYPTCPECNSYLRPDATLFTEALPEESWRLSSKAISRLSKDDVFIIVGTSGVVYPAASLAARAISKGAKTIEINIDPSPFSHSVDHFLQGPSGQVLSKTVQEYEKLWANQMKPL